MYPYYRAGLCLCGVFRLCLLWPVAIAALWSAGGDICGVYGIYSVDILTVECASKHNDKLMSYYSGLSGAVHFGTLVFNGLHWCTTGFSYTPLLGSGFSAARYCGIAMGAECT